MEAGLATYAANPNVGQYKATSVTMPAPGPKMTKTKTNKKDCGMACKSKKKK